MSKDNNPKSETEMIRTSTYIYKDEYHQLRAILISQYKGKSVSSWMRSVIRSFLKKHQEEQLQNSKL